MPSFNKYKWTSIRAVSKLCSRKTMITIVRQILQIRVYIKYIDQPWINSMELLRSLKIIQGRSLQFLHLLELEDNMVMSLNLLINYLKKKKKFLKRKRENQVRNQKEKRRKKLNNLSQQRNKEENHQRLIYLKSLTGSINVIFEQEKLLNVKSAKILRSFFPHKLIQVKALYVRLGQVLDHLSLQKR